MNHYESDKEQEKIRRIDDYKDERTDDVPELLHLKMIQKYWNSFADDEQLVSPTI